MKEAQCDDRKFRSNNNEKHTYFETLEDVNIVNNTVIYLINNGKKKNIENNIDTKNFGNLKKLLIIILRALRFTRNLKSKASGKNKFDKLFK